jgi:ketosteroid isomerase-like protein
VAATRGAPDLEVDLDVIDPVSERVCIGRVRTSGTAPGGGRFEIVAPFVVQSDDEGRCVLIEVLDDGAEEAAYARAAVVEELRPRVTVDTAATRARNALVRNLNGREWQRLAALLAPAVVLVDHRPAGQGRIDGRDANVEGLQSLVKVLPTLRWDERIVATHGDDLVVTVAEVHGRGDHGVDARAAFAQCTSVGRDGRIFRSDVYASEEEALRRMRLLARWEQGLGAWTDAIATRDAGRLEPHFAPDLVVVDHRRGLRDRLTGIDQVLAFWELGGTTDVVVHLDVVEAEPVVALMLMSIRGRTEHTSEYVVEALQLVAVDEQLRASYVEIFDLEDRAQAVTRFEQVAAERQPAGA